MSLSHLLALLSFLFNILGTVATIIAAIFAYQGLKQFQALNGKFEKLSGHTIRN
jgi:hypothetical protein